MTSTAARTVTPSRNSTPRPRRLSQRVVSAPLFMVLPAFGTGTKQFRLTRVEHRQTSRPRAQGVPEVQDHQRSISS
jgi:hypothetical protein